MREKIQYIFNSYQHIELAIVHNLHLWVFSIVLQHIQFMYRYDVSFNIATSDNKLYSAVEKEKSLERVKGEQREIEMWPTQSQDHVYEFEGSTSFNQSVEATYAEVGPLDVMVYVQDTAYIM